MPLLSDPSNLGVRSSLPGCRGCSVENLEILLAEKEKEPGVTDLSHTCASSVLGPSGEREGTQHWLPSHMASNTPSMFLGAEGAASEWSVHILNPGPCEYALIGSLWIQLH